MINKDELKAIEEHYLTNHPDVADISPQAAYENACRHIKKLVRYVRLLESENDIFQSQFKSMKTVLSYRASRIKDLSKEEL